MSRQPMSMEALLDEERREVLALLQGSKARSASSMGARSPSPFNSPRSPVRSMLDIGDDSPPPRSMSSSPGVSRKTAPQNLPVRSMLDISAPAAPPRSMLDIAGPASPPISKVLSNPTSPIETNHRAHASNQTITHPRSLSDAATRPAEFGPRASSSRPDPTSGYQFSGIITPNTGHALPTRASQGGKRHAGSNSMAEVMRGNDVGTIILPGDRGRHYSIAGPSTRTGNKSKSPHGGPSMRSRSPLVGRNLSPGGRNLAPESDELDMSNAYRRLSDANLARSGGSLAEFGLRKTSGDTASSGRLVKDYLDDDDGIPEESSDDDDEDLTSDDEGEGERGRKAARSYEGSKAGDKLAKKGGTKKADRKSLSLLAAAEEERVQVAAQQPYQYRSLFDEPEITVTNPSGEKVKQSKGGVHPATSFDEPPMSSGFRTPVDSDTEADLTDIKRAQKLGFAMTPILSTAESHRAIRIIYRGEYTKIVQDAEEEHRRLRKYLVATDLSEESTHALEWTIGTVLRDGDTLIAIYCVDEETGIVTGDGVLIPDDPKAMKQEANAINAVAGTRAPVTPGGNLLPLQNRAPALALMTDSTSSFSHSPEGSSRERSKADEERRHAVQDITDRVTKLLRKTRLQVRVIVEVLHCKNPKHLITEVIDIVNPTLVILGSRGRSALKGVILGSFSNYLVTKSSVPVMVARKRLRKASKYKRPFHQVNNLSNPTASGRSLANAKID